MDRLAGKVELAAAKHNGEIEVGLAATEMMAQTHQVGDDNINVTARRGRATMRPVRVARDKVEFQIRVELYGPLHRLETMRRNRELGERKTPRRAPQMMTRW
jgi:hypothetical protein